MATVVVVGGGISGLATAYSLEQARPDVTVTVLEAASRPGGTIWTERRDGFQVEVGANGFLDSKPSTLALCQRLGLGDAVVPASAAAKHRYLFHNNRLQALPEGLWSFLTSPLLSWRGKVGVLRERFRPPKADDGDESVAAFARRRLGPEAGLLADAMVTGIHAGDPELLSFPAAFPRFAALEREHGSLMRAMDRLAARRRQEGRPGGSRLLSFRDGLRRLIEALAGRLRRPPILGAAVRRLEKNAHGGPPWRFVGEGRDAWEADAVILACPAHQQAAILSDLDPGLARAAESIPYAAAAVVGLGYRQSDVPMSINGFGFIAPQRTRRDILGAQWCSSIFPDRAPPGLVLLRAIAGGWHRADVAGWDDDRLLTAVRGEFRAAMGITAAPVFHHVARWPRAIPQYHLGHRDRVADILRRAAAHPGLFLTGNAYQGVAMNDCTEQGEIVAGQIARFLGP